MPNPPKKRKKQPSSSVKRDAQAEELGYWYDAETAERCVEFFPTFLVHAKGALAGQPFHLEKWQADIIRQIFGWKRADGTRRYRTVYIEIPRKNGKSTLCAGIALLLLFCDREQGAEIYSAAGDRAQAGIVFDVAKQMRSKSSTLLKMSKAFRGSITVESTASFYKALSADADNKHGFNAHGIIFDELHVQPNRDLWDVLITSVGARKQPLTVAITTAGYDRTSLCWEIHDYACKVRDGVIIDETFFPVIYAAEPEDDWTKEETWKKANPQYGISISREFFEEQVRKAQNSPSYENTFKRLFLNIWTEQDVRWIPMHRWDACSFPFKASELIGRECFGALDLASTSDIAAFVLLFPEDEGYLILPFFFVPEEHNARARNLDQTYQAWIKKKLMIATPGNVIDFDRIRSTIQGLGKLYEIKEIAFDRWNATQLVTQLAGDGFEMVAFGQGFGSMSAPTKELETLILSERIAHAGNEVLRWMMSNVSVEQDAAGNLKPSKKKSKEKIDGIVATVMALGRAILRPEHNSVYDNEGLLVL